VIGVLSIDRNSKCEVVATFRQPFDLLAETAVSAARAAAGETAKTAKTEIWLGD
jgi:site-specific DNA recombinase